MGQLTALKLPTETVSTPGGDITVRALAFEDLWIIATDHGPQATMLFQKIVNKEKFDFVETRAVLQGLLPEMPGMVATAIALAADDPEGRDVARKLPPRVQLDALEKVFKLTVESEAELKALGESIVRLLSGATGFAQTMRAPLSEAGFGELGGE